MVVYLYTHLIVIRILRSTAGSHAGRPVGSRLVLWIRLGNMSMMRRMVLRWHSSCPPRGFILFAVVRLAVRVLRVVRNSWTGLSKVEVKLNRLANHVGKLEFLIRDHISPPR